MLSSFKDNTKQNGQLKLHIFSYDNIVPSQKVKTVNFLFHLAPFIGRKKLTVQQIVFKNYNCISFSIVIDCNFSSKRISENRKQRKNKKLLQAKYK